MRTFNAETQTAFDYSQFVHNCFLKKKKKKDCISIMLYEVITARGRESEIIQKNVRYVYLRDKDLEDNSYCIKLINF